MTGSTTYSIPLSSPLSGFGSAGGGAGGCTTMMIGLLFSLLDAFIKGNSSCPLCRLSFSLFASSSASSAFCKAVHGKEIWNYLNYKSTSFFQYTISIYHFSAIGKSGTYLSPQPHQQLLTVLLLSAAAL